MRHKVAGRQLSRNTAHRKALRRNMAASLFQHGAIRTTVPKAKELKPFVERIITIARTGTLHARRRVISLMGDRLMADSKEEILDKTVIQKLFDDIAPRYAERPGGYTRIIRLSDHRIGDAAPTCLLQLVEEKSAEEQQPASRSRRRRLAAKRKQQAQAAQEQQAAAAQNAKQPETPAQSQETEPEGEKKE
ncbi:MAG: 50S ribosomal protein L17 [Planctomycetes bacterium]|nr:50S ribosomal protein L17 [Planctomycetota bacterium]